VSFYGDGGLDASFRIAGLNQESGTMAKPNYSFAKRQRELEKKNKKEEKRKQKAEGKDGAPEDGATEATENEPSVAPESGADPV
jgi:hypothetical protein